jgi:NADPH:quinone reductase-like Zn-dependent oxidoreductase
MNHDVLVRVMVAGVNPVDNFVISGALPKIIHYQIIYPAKFPICPIPTLTKVGCPLNIA